MKKTILASILVLTSFLFTAAQTATDQVDRDAAAVKIVNSATALANISSTSAGGPWSSPSTWVGGTVPGETDDVTIASGATVVVDTEAKAASVTIGGGAFSARLTFDEAAGRSLTVTNDLAIGANDAFSTGNGAVNTHVVSIGGNLTNNGTLDLSTNNNLAGATIKFTGGANSIFGGTGAVTDVYKIEQGKSVPGAITDLAVSNFTVQGSNADTAGSGYLNLTGGIFKISGTFNGEYKTFPDAAYNVPAAAGLWLNNPNYTIVAQAASAEVHGSLRVSAGTYNVGIVNAHDLSIDSTVNFIMEGGKINAAGDFGVRSPQSTVSGGTITSCVATPAPNCLMEFKDSGTQGTTVMSGGDLVLQNAGTYRYDAPLVTAVPTLRGTRLHFGNALTSAPGTFNLLGQAPNVILDSTAGVQVKVTANWAPVRMNDLSIDINSIFEFKSLHLHGNNIVVNGILAKTCLPPAPDPTCASAILEFDDLSGTTDTTFSGSGILNEVGDLKIRARKMTFDFVSNVKAVYNVWVTNARIVNAGKITLGNNDSGPKAIRMYDGASLDNAPDFKLGSSTQDVYYRGYPDGFTTGPEINPSRIVSTFTVWGPGKVILSGGDLWVNNGLAIPGGILDTGPYTVTTYGPLTNVMPIGWVEGNLRTRVSVFPTNPVSTVLKVGANGTYSPITVTPVSGGIWSFVTVRAFDATLPGLIPSLSASRYWAIVEEGNITARLTLTPAASDINGDPANYQRYRSDGSTVVPVPETNINALTGYWGLGVADAPVSIGGSITTAGGQPIRNATVRISGGNLPAPIEATTGSFGSYGFTGLQVGVQYTINVSAKRYRFTPNSQTVTPFGNVGNLNFSANPEE